ncbi:MAG TPA: metalloregulator ArsR/SmtB family transcription factor [Tepiditoga sp.]|nr:winged helix-turn-helix transcriptional regulator [Thermotogota bacterium]HOO74273.1 metalloregulator ArsR/SmtB family transcription factor [Tepiditoga sp.]
MDNRVKVLKALAHDERLKILDFIKDEPKCVCEIIKISNFTQSNLSQHLKILRDADIVDYEKDGNKVVYSIKSQEIREMMTFLENNYVHMA